MNKEIASALLVLLGLVVYAPALRAGFVGDDRALVLTDPLIRSWRLIWEGFQHFLLPMRVVPIFTGRCSASAISLIMQRSFLRRRAITS